MDDSGAKFWLWGGCAYLGSEGKSLYIPLNFARNLKTALKIKVY